MKVGEYIFLAAGCVSLGIIITFIVLGVCQRFGINIEQHWWIVAIPVVLSLVVNVTLVEIYRKLRKSKG
jgi:ABC-type multidrug transport system permease subunit